MQLRLLFSMFFCAFLSVAYSQSVGLIGSATPNGWDSDTDMVQDPMNDSLWTLTIDLTQDAVKFRWNDDWAVNWGGEGWPWGVGEQDGPDIQVSHAGTYNITFSSATGEYYFEIVSPVGIIGSATPGGWDDDTNMFQDSLNPNLFLLTLDLTDGAAKFRTNDNWDVNWGATDFPTGVGTQGGPDIPIPSAGKFSVTIDTSTGAYTFEEIITIANVALTGAGTGGTDIELTKANNDPNLWRGNVTLVDGGVQFQANQDLALTWGWDGGMDTLVGTAVAGGPVIPVPAGDYQVTFDAETGDYSFLVIGNYSTIGIIGSATANGWAGPDTDMMQDPNDRSIWTLRTILKTGEVKFRANDMWVVDWGSGDFPMGVGIQGGANIPVDTGEYKITFNSTTGEYNFEALVIYSSMGIIGTGTEFMNWDDDVQMSKDNTDETFWYANSVDLVDGEIKFRAEGDWAVNWGNPAWPTGVGTQGGDNIICVAGTYGVTLATVSGEYAFGPPLATEELLRPDAVTLVPNPARDMVRLDISTDKLTGDAQVLIFNQLGALVSTQNVNLNNQVQLNVANLPTGNYTVQVRNGKYIVGKTLVVVK